MKGRQKGETKEKLQEKFNKFVKVIGQNKDIKYKELLEKYGYSRSYISRNKGKALSTIRQREDKQKTKNSPDIKEIQLSLPNSEPNNTKPEEVNMPLTPEDITKITEELKKGVIEPLKVDLSDKIDKIKNNIKEGKMPDEGKEPKSFDISKIIEEVKKEVGKAVSSTVNQEFNNRELERRRQEEDAKKAKEQKELTDTVKSQKDEIKTLQAQLGAMSNYKETCDSLKECKIKIADLEKVVKIPKEEKPTEKKEIKKTTEEVKKEEPKKTKVDIILEKLNPITKEVRDSMEKEEQEKRDAKVRGILDKYNISLVDAWRQIERDKVSMDNLPQKKEIRQAVLTSMTDTELAEAAKTCVGEECTLIKMEKDERGNKKYVIRDGKEWKPFGEKEGPHI